MTQDPLQHAWQAQPARLNIDAELLLKEVQRNEKTFAAKIFWRDVREVGIALVMLPAWVAIGWFGRLPWSWYLMIPSLLWVVGFFLVDRLRHRSVVPVAGEPLGRRVELSLGHVEHQIWLLRNVFWWYILPFIPPALAFIGHVAWITREGGWAMGMIIVLVLAANGVIVEFIYRVNQKAIRSSLEPRREELVKLLAGLRGDGGG